MPEQHLLLLIIVSPDILSAGFARIFCLIIF